MLETAYKKSYLSTDFPLDYPWSHYLVHYLCIFLSSSVLNQQQFKKHSSKLQQAHTYLIAIFQVKTVNSALLLKADTHSRITWAMLHSRVTRVQYGWLLTHVTPVVHGWVVRVPHGCVYQELCSRKFLPKILEKTRHVMLFRHYGCNTQSGQHTGAYFDAVRHGPCWFLSRGPSTCRQPIPVARHLQSFAAITHGRKSLSSFSM